jgi:lycopene beta-cyclase
MEIECEEPHGLAIPIVMDAASVGQVDGYHFVYVLPFTPTRLLVEDTYYSDERTIESENLRQVIRAYATARNWKIKSIVREEHGALPIPFGPSSKPTVGEFPTSTAVGWRGGWFHPTTGYSFGLGIRVAAAIARSWATSRGRDRRELHRLASQARRQGVLARRLNRLLFTAFAPENRMHVLERFHRVRPDDSIARFYALAMTRADQWRLFVGRPPKGFSGRRLLSHWWSGAAR